MFFLFNLRTYTNPFYEIVKIRVEIYWFPKTKLKHTMSSSICPKYRHIWSHWMDSALINSTFSFIKTYYSLVYFELRKQIWNCKDIIYKILFAEKEWNIYITITKTVCDRYQDDELFWTTVCDVEIKNLGQINKTIQ